MGAFQVIIFSLIQWQNTNFQIPDTKSEHGGGAIHTGVFAARRVESLV